MNKACRARQKLCCSDWVFRRKRCKRPKIKTPSVSSGDGPPGGAEQSQQIELHTHANKLTQRCIQRGAGGRSGHTVRVFTHRWSAQCLFVPQASWGCCMIWDYMTYVYIYSSVFKPLSTLKNPTAHHQTKILWNDTKFGRNCGGKRGFPKHNHSTIIIFIPIHIIKSNWMFDFYKILHQFSNSRKVFSTNAPQIWIDLRANTHLCPSSRGPEFTVNRGDVFQPPLQFPLTHMEMGRTFGPLSSFKSISRKAPHKVRGGSRQTFHIHGATITSIWME